MLLMMLPIILLISSNKKVDEQNINRKYAIAENDTIWSGEVF
jgi:hypothetical protein